VISRLKASVLCIDDHWSGLIGRKMLLEGNGYEVLAATGGDEGLRLFFCSSRILSTRCSSTTGCLG